jgi:hypothetical protein
MVGIHLGGGDVGFGDGSQLGGQVITLGFGTAGDTDVGEHLADLAAFLDGDRGHATAADDQNSTHILSTPFRFFVKKHSKKLSAFLKKSLAKNFKAALHDLAREDCEENFRQNKAENRRNPLWISRFDNAVMAEICRKTPQTQLCGVAGKS